MANEAWLSYLTEQNVAQFPDSLRADMFTRALLAGDGDAMQSIAKLPLAANARGFAPTPPVQDASFYSAKNIKRLQDFFTWWEKNEPTSTVLSEWASLNSTFVLSETLDKFDRYKADYELVQQLRKLGWSFSLYGRTPQSILTEAYRQLEAQRTNAAPKIINLRTSRHIVQTEDILFKAARAMFMDKTVSHRQRIAVTPTLFTELHAKYRYTDLWVEDALYHDKYSQYDQHKMNAGKTTIHTSFTLGGVIDNKTYYLEIVTCLGASGCKREDKLLDATMQLFRDKDVPLPDNFAVQRIGIPPYYQWKAYTGVETQDNLVSSKTFNDLFSCDACEHTNGEWINKSGYYRELPVEHLQCQECYRTNIAFRPKSTSQADMQAWRAHQIITGQDPDETPDPALTNKDYAC